MTQPFSPPPTRQSRPGPPLVTRNPAAGNKPGAAVPATTPAGRTPAQPARTTPTSTVLAWWRAFTVLVCLVVAVVAPLVLNDNRDSLIQVNDSAQQVLRLQAVRGDVLAADAAASSALVDAGAEGDLDTGYQDLLARTSAEIVAASVASPDDQAELMAVNSGLSSYVGALTRGLTTRDPARLAEAHDELESELLPAIDQQIQLNDTRLQMSLADQRWLSILVGVPGLVLLAASVVLARRTRRVINVGLLIGLAITVAAFVNTYQLTTTSASSVGAVREGSLVQATAAARAYSAVTEAKAWQSRWLAGAEGRSNADAGFTQALAAADGALAELPAASAAGMVTQLENMRQAHAQLLAAEGDPAAQAAGRTSSAAAYTVLVEWLPGQASQIGADLDTQIGEHALTVRNAIGLTAIAMVAAALAAGIGISQPLRRYR